MNIVRDIFLLSLLCLSSAVQADSSGVEITISHKTTGYAQGHCSEGFIIKKSIGGETIKLNIQLKFVGIDPANEFTGNIHSSLTGSRAGGAKKVYIESPDLCFKVKEVIIIKAEGKVKNKKIDFIEEGRINQTDFKVYPISINKNG